MTRCELTFVYSQTKGFSPQSRVAAAVVATGRIDPVSKGFIEELQQERLIRLADLIQ